MRRITKSERRLQEQNIQLIAENWNLKYREGQRVRFWTGLREGEGRTGVTWTTARHMGDHVSVYIRDDAGKNIGSVSLTHVEAITLDSVTDV